MSDGTSFIFNLTDRISYLCLQKEEAVMCYKDIGPYFGVIRELAAWTEPFNGEGNCVCYANHKGYGVA